MSSTDSTDSTNITATIENFLEAWDRHDWMQEHGDWVSSEWDEARAEYVGAFEALQDAIADLPSADRADVSSIESVRAALKTLELAAVALKGQVRPDESDYISEGTIDPDGVADEAEKLTGEQSWQGWDCREGWAPHRVDNDLYINWWRQAWGDRHQRDLWVLVYSDFFEDEDEDE